MCIRDSNNTAKVYPSATNVIKNNEPTNGKEAAGLEVRLQEELKALKDQQRSSIRYRRGGLGAKQTLKIMKKEQDLHKAKNPGQKFPSFYGE